MRKKMLLTNTAEFIAILTINTTLMSTLNKTSMKINNKEINSGNTGIILISIFLIGWFIVINLLCLMLAGIFPNSHMTEIINHVTNWAKFNTVAILVAHTGITQTSFMIIIYYFLKYKKL
jgi:hypothetical protein